MLSNTGSSAPGRSTRTDEVCSVNRRRKADGPVTLDAHGMDPVKVLALASSLGPVPERILVVGCEPAVRMSGEEEEIVGELSGPVRAAVEPAAELVESLVRQIVEEREGGGTR